MPRCRWNGTVSGNTLPEIANPVLPIKVSTGKAGNYCKNPKHPYNESIEKKYEGDGKDWAKCEYNCFNNQQCKYYSPEIN